MKMINLTQHPATAEQAVAGVVEPRDKAAVQAALTADALPSAQDIRRMADDLAAIAAEHGADTAMIGGAPWLMGALERALIDRGIAPVYAFSVRESAEAVQPDGSTKKVAVFRHAGFVPAVAP
jgi:hypothetical protein